MYVLRVVRGVVRETALTLIELLKLSESIKALTGRRT